MDLRELLWEPIVKIASSPVFWLLFAAMCTVNSFVEGTSDYWWGVVNGVLGSAAILGGIYDE